MQPSSIIRHATDARRLLAGDWGLLFSHPEDFEEGGLERDRWIQMLRAAFREDRVLPLVLDPGHCEARNAWVWAIDSRSGYVGASFDPRDLSARVAPLDRGALPEAFVRSLDAGTRFVAVIGPEGRCVQVCRYAATHRPVAVFDVLGLVAKLKRAAAASQAASSRQFARR